MKDRKKKSTVKHKYNEQRREEKRGFKDGKERFNNKELKRTEHLYMRVQYFENVK